MVWKRPPLDLTELAKYRWIHGWTLSELGQRFDRSVETIKTRLRQLRRSGDWRDLKLSKADLKTIEEKLKTLNS